jgi:hypothetical protein
MEDAHHRPHLFRRRRRSRRSSMRCRCGRRCARTTGRRSSGSTPARPTWVAPRLADASRLGSAGDKPSQPPADGTASAQSPVREPGLFPGAGLSSREANSAAPFGAASDVCVAGTESVAGDAAVEVLPGCSQAVYKGKYQAAVRCPRALSQAWMPVVAIVAVAKDERNRLELADPTGCKQVLCCTSCVLRCVECRLVCPWCRTILRRLRRRASNGSRCTGLSS